MEDFFDQDKAKAFVYLLSEGDDTNKVFLSEEKLLVIRKNQRNTFALNELKGLKTETKKQLFPLIIGGIITPFAFLSYFVNLFLPWVHLISVMVGMLLFYLGWSGKNVMTLVYKNGDELNYYLPYISKNLQAFMDFVNVLLKNSSTSIHGDLLYFELEENDEDILFGRETKKQIFPLYGYTYDQVIQSRKSIKQLTVIDPMKAGIEIKFSYDLNSNQMRPVIERSILPESNVNFE